VVASLLPGGCGDDGAVHGETDTGVGTTTGDGTDSGGSTGGVVECMGPAPYATEVVSFTPGANAGFGQPELPDVVLGPPVPGDPGSSSLDVLSLGVGGEIVLGFGNGVLADGPGPDLVIWENAFWINGDPTNPFAELGEVAVSADGELWDVFPCDPGLTEGFDPGCAGWRPRQAFDPCVVPLDPAISGGDPFDLADLGVTDIRFVRIRDLAQSGSPSSAGFDLDAVGAVHLQ
jgi:hypothetical protein